MSSLVSLPWWVYPLIAVWFVTLFLLVLGTAVRAIELVSELVRESWGGRS
jgi:hypothetical protein